jgi:hypothetical protein
MAEESEARLSVFDPTDDFNIEEEEQKVVLIPAPPEKEFFHVLQNLRFQVVSWAPLS